MQMDLLRSCYTTEMRFWKDRPDTVPVRWFWCDEEAEIFPGHHRFASGVWAAKYGPWEGPGEVEEAPRPFDPGVNPGLDGHKFCGPKSSYAEGSPWPGKPLLANAAGLCPCCVDVIPPCNTFYDTLPDTLHAKILAVSTNAPQVAGHVGDTFTLTKNFAGVYVSDVGFTVPFFPCGWTIFIACGQPGPGVLGLYPNSSVFATAPDTLTVEPFKAVWIDNAMSLSFQCNELGILEVWTLEVRDVPF